MGKGNTDNAAIARLETRLTRLGKARQALDIVMMRLKQTERRAPQLRVIIEGAYDNLDEALDEISKEFEQTRQERWPAKEH